MKSDFPNTDSDVPFTFMSNILNESDSDDSEMKDLIELAEIEAEEAKERGEELDDGAHTLSVRSHALFELFKRTSIVELEKQLILEANDTKYKNPIGLGFGLVRVGEDSEDDEMVNESLHMSESDIPLPDISPDILALLNHYDYDKDSETVKPSSNNRSLQLQTLIREHENIAQDKLLAEQNILKAWEIEKSLSDMEAIKHARDCEREHRESAERTLDEVKAKQELFHITEQAEQEKQDIEDAQMEVERAKLFRERERESRDAAQRALEKAKDELKAKQELFLIEQAEQEKQEIENARMEVERAKLYRERERESRDAAQRALEKAKCELAEAINSEGTASERADAMNALLKEKDSYRNDIMLAKEAEFEMVEVERLKTEMIKAKKDRDRERDVRQAAQRALEKAKSDLDTVITTEATSSERAA
jgi:hypothetical protein